MSEFFRRRETKYEIDRKAYEQLRQVIQTHLPPFHFRPNRPHTYITTIYFDTESLKFFERACKHYDDSLKLRVKEYYYKPDSGGLETSKICFIELKQRVEGEVFKKRLRLPKSLVRPFFAGEDVWPQLVASDPGIEFQDSVYQVYRELRQFLHENKVTPHSVINYRRLVYQQDESELRVTFDDMLQVYRPTTDFYENVPALTRESLGAPIRSIPSTIMEIKCQNGYPVWLEKALYPHHPRKISKFTTSMDFLLGTIRERHPAEKPAVDAALDSDIQLCPECRDPILERSPNAARRTEKPAADRLGGLGPGAQRIEAEDSAEPLRDA